MLLQAWNEPFGSVIAKGLALVVAAFPMFAACSTEPCDLLPNDGIRVEVRDAVTGGPAADGATAQVTEGTIRKC